MMYGVKRSVKNRRVNYYTITLNPHFDSFAISPTFLYEKALKFVYELNGETIEKVVPMTYIGPKLGKARHIYHNDPLTGDKEYCGFFYTIIKKFIIDYEED